VEVDVKIGKEIEELQGGGEVEREGYRRYWEREWLKGGVTKEDELSGGRYRWVGGRWRVSRLRK